MKDINFNKIQVIPYGNIVGEFITHSTLTRQSLVEISVPVNSSNISTASLSYADILRKSLISRDLQGCLIHSTSTKKNKRMA